ncbi:nicotinate phosphoribosyltransferase [Alistipes sp. ZOR0009]|jgi:nicotinate phosphoribosyltransferase|uniref:nicotinate phosphoribosyltransferase n=1 Tax=Alistipes sp. ZOR0009 TaxID=1339253 RepID=UPI0006457B3D|nr:nicotinate phosphoribosyltransferase [Alistipes sp. ZOR0009]
MIITEFLDNDLYKFTTMNAIQKKFPNAEVVYRFVNRAKTKFPEGFDRALRAEVDSMANLTLSDEAKCYLRSKCYFFEPVFIDLLKGFRFDPSEVVITQVDGDLDIEIRGLWYRTVLWEVPLLAIVSELFFIMTGQKAIEVEDRALAKAKAFADLQAEVSEFGTRRRFSFDVQDRVVGVLKQGMGSFFKGTSNLFLAYKHGVTPIGTHPHEWFMYHGAQFGYRIANSIALENWVDVYQGHLGIALTDTFTTDNFFQHFGSKYSKLFDGVRWDSGDPIVFTDKALKHYEAMKIDPKSKTIVYSDSLNVEKVRQIKEHVNGRIHDVYGIGTYLSNDVGVNPLNIVIKLFEVKPNGAKSFVPTVKLSDDRGKYTGSDKEVQLCLLTINQ